MSDNPIKAWIDEHRAIHAAATDGTWYGYALRFSRGVGSTALTGPDKTADAVVEDRYLTSQDRDAIVDAHNITVPTALSMVEAVLAIHKPAPPYLLDVPEVCDSCSDNEDEREVEYPCPLICALEGVIDGG